MSFGTQIVGIIAIWAFVFVPCSCVLFLLQIIIGLRPEDEDEAIGLDRSECGIETYSELGRGSRSI